MTRAVLLLIAFTSGPLLFAADLSGRVVDSQDGTPVPRAHVTFALPGEHPFSVTVSTDAVGNFRVTNLPEGDLQLSTEKAGYIGETSFPAADAKTVVLHFDAASHSYGIGDGR